MNAQTLKREIETEAASALRQLDSDEFLRAAAGGEPTTQALLETAAASEHAAAMTFETWIQTESDTNAQAAFERVAEQEHTHYDRVTTVMDAIGVGGTDTDVTGTATATVTVVPAVMIPTPKHTLRMLQDRCMRIFVVVKPQYNGLHLGWLVVRSRACRRMRD